MHFGLALDSSDIDLWKDAHLDLRDAGITNKYFAFLQDVFKTCLQDVFKTCLRDVFKTCLEDVLKTSSV